MGLWDWLIGPREPKRWTAADWNRYRQDNYSEADWARYRARLRKVQAARRAAAAEDRRRGL